MFQPSRGHPQRILIHFMSRVICKYQITKQCVVCYMAVVKHNSVNKVVLTNLRPLVRFLSKISQSIIYHHQNKMKNEHYSTLQIM